MKKWVLIAFLFACAVPALHAQTDTTNADDEKVTVIIKVLDRWDDKLVFEITNDMWLDLPEGVELAGFSPGFKAQFYTDYTFGSESIVSFAWGFGISADNVRSNARPVQQEFSDGSLSDQEIVPYPEKYDYEKNKFVTTYLELPIEFRIITYGRSPFKFAAGFRLGYLLADHQKIIDTDGKRKLYDFNDITTWRYGVSARIGVGKVQLTGFYSLTPLIEGTDNVIPFSVGIALTPIR